jgi:hypothetical protein
VWLGLRGGRHFYTPPGQTVKVRRILFNTNRFNLSKVGAHFINPCCFGEDLALWLRDKLIAKGAAVSSSGQEDWGWYLNANSGTDGYFLGMSGNTKGNSANPDDGEWGIIIKKNRTIMQRITGKGKIAVDDAMFALVEAILHGETDFREVHEEVQ